MLIGEVAAAVGVTVKAVRFYAEQGLLGSVKVSLWRRSER
jgi:DNA-binding transcriptional MerR regulator